jgi:hypothetical protein
LTITYRDLKSFRIDYWVHLPIRNGSEKSIEDYQLIAAAFAGACQAVFRLRPDVVSLPNHDCDEAPDAPDRQDPFRGQSPLLNLLISAFQISGMTEAKAYRKTASMAIISDILT